MKLWWLKLVVPNSMMNFLHVWYGSDSIHSKTLLRIGLSMQNILELFLLLFYSCPWLGISFWLISLPCRVMGSIVQKKVRVSLRLGPQWFSFAEWSIPITHQFTNLLLKAFMPIYGPVTFVPFCGYWCVHWLMNNCIFYYWCRIPFCML